MTAEDADDGANSDIGVKVGSGSMTMEATVKAAVPVESVVAYPRIATTVIARENEAMRLSDLLWWSVVTWPAEALGLTIWKTDFFLQDIRNQNNSVHNYMYIH